MLNLDTHVLLALAADRLNRHEHSLLRRVPRWGISSIVLWEMEMLHRKGRIRRSLDDPEVADLLSTIQIWPIDTAVCLCLRELDFRSDPADEIIAATSLAHRVPLVTRDARLRRSRVVRFAN